MDTFNRSNNTYRQTPHRWFISALLVLSLTGVSITSHAQTATQSKPAAKVKASKKTTATIEQRAISTVKRSFKAYVGENTQALLALYHPQSSLKQETAEAVQAYFDENKLIGELVETKYLSHDKDYAYVTAKVITRDVGPNIRLSKYERDILFILKPYGNAYLIWVFRTLDNPVLNETTF